MEIKSQRDLIYHITSNNVGVKNVIPPATEKIIAEAESTLKENINENISNIEKTKIPEE